MNAKIVIVGVTPHSEQGQKQIEEELKAHIQSVKGQYCFAKQEEPKVRVFYSGKSGAGKDEQCTPLHTHRWQSEQSNRLKLNYTLTN